MGSFVGGSRSSRLIIVREGPWNEVETVLMQTFDLARQRTGDVVVTGDPNPSNDLTRTRQW